MNYYTDEPEWKWLFNNAIDWDNILPLYFPKFPTEEGFENKKELLEFFEEMLGQVGNWAANTVAKRAEKLDREGAGVVRDGKTIVRCFGPFPTVGHSPDTHSQSLWECGGRLHRVLGRM